MLGSRRASLARSRPVFVAAVSWLTLGWGHGAGAQVPAVARPSPSSPPQPLATAPALPGVDSVKPLPPFEIPDPPPHEGALIDVPDVVQPPDLLLVEVLVALPGRPISGERLVRPDGAIDLGFYGTVHVRGLTLAQVKEKVVLHLRAYLSDETLGLKESDDRDDEPAPGRGPVPPPLPRDREHSPFDLEAPPRRPPTVLSPSQPPPPPTVPAPPATRLSPGADFPPGAVPARSAFRPTAGPRSAIRVGHQQPAAPPNPPDDGNRPHPPATPPAETRRVFVSKTSYNGASYYVQGDVGKPGRLPCTGNDTVLDAIQYVEGLTDTADRGKIVLHRPARGTKPTRSYPINLDAILHGDAASNLQLFPGDRLLIGRRERSAPPATPLP